MKLKTKTKEICKRVATDKKLRYVLTIPWIIGCLIFMFFVLKRGIFRYESNDDMYLSFLVNGIYGKYYTHNIWNNYILSSLFVGMYKLSNAHNWSFLYYFCLIFLSYIVFGVWNIYKNKLVPAYLTSFLLVVSTYNALLTRMNFSKSASIIIAVGFILLTTSIDNDKWRDKCNIVLRCVAYAFIFAGIIIRWDCCLAAIPFLIILAGYILIKYKREYKKVIPFVGVLFGIFLVWGSNYIVYHQDEGWRYWQEYNDPRASLLDYAMVDYDENAAKFEEIGISANDYESLKNWIYADDTVFDIDTMKKIENIRDESIYSESKYSKQNIENAVLNSLSLFNNNSFIYVVLFLFLTLAPILKKRETIVLIGFFIVCFGEVFFLILKQRCPERAFFVPLLIFFAISVYFMNEISKEKVWIHSFLILCMLIFSFYGSNFYSLGRTEGFTFINRDETIGMLSELSSNQENLYVWDGHEHDLLRYVYSPFDVPEFGLEKNFVMLGGWMVPSPIMSERTEAFGEKYNYLKLLAENPNVYFVTASGDALDNIEQYIREHYNPNASRLLVREINDYYVYSFVLENN